MGASPPEEEGEGLGEEREADKSGHTCELQRR